MTSFDYRLNPRYPIKECSSCEALYTTYYCCSNGSLVDKIIRDLNKAPDSPHLHTLSSNQRHCFHCKDVLGDGEIYQRCTCTRCGSGLRKGLCLICKHNQNSLNTSPSISANSSQSPSQINHHCCSGYGNPLEGIFCHQCTCQLCGNGAHYGYNCLPKVPIIPDPEPFHNHTIKELPPTVQCFDPKSDLVYNSHNVFSPSLQPLGYSYEFCGNDAYYGQDGSLQVPFTYELEPCYNQDFNFPQNYSHDSYGNDSHFGYDCQPQFPLNYDHQPPQEMSIQEMEDLKQLYLGEMKRLINSENRDEIKIAELKKNFNVTPSLPIKDPDNSLSMGDEHLDTIPATKSDEFIKSSVENLIPIPSESEGI
nr:hypothetical protein [Tanacetum cinerariifolium]